MIIFGQGLNRAHPNLIKIIDSIQKGNDEKGFVKEVTGFLNHFATNAGRSVFRGLFRPRSKGKDLLTYYEAQLGRLAANFAVSADLALVLGGRLKFEEMLSGRFADAFGTLYLGYSCLWYYNQNRNVEGIDTVFELAMENLLQQNQTALMELSRNFPIPGIGPMMRFLSFPLGGIDHKGPSDALVKKASHLITTPSGVRNLLTEGIFISNDPQDQLRKLVDTFPLSVKADQMIAAAKKAKRPLTTEEQDLVNKVNVAVNELIQVDSFEKLGIEKYQGDDYVRPALRHTKFANLKTQTAVPA
jgi:acyl-CoA dehydrogenase